MPRAKQLERKVHQARASQEKELEAAPVPTVEVRIACTCRHPVADRSHLLHWLCRMCGRLIPPNATQAAAAAPPAATDALRDSETAFPGSSTILSDPRAFSPGGE